MITLRDVTELRALAEESKIGRRKIITIEKMLKIEQSKLVQYYQS